MEISQTNDQDYMRLALAEARLAEEAGEVPIGAVVVCNGEVIARAHNTRETDRNPAGHAEFSALLAAAKALDAWRLSDCTVYVTLEPCYGAADPKAGALGSLYEIHRDTRLNHTFAVEAGVLEDECASILKAFFAAKRAQNKQKKKEICS